jgi:hypothetical protein
LNCWKIHHIFDVRRKNLPRIWCQETKDLLERPWLMETWFGKRKDAEVEEEGPLIDLYAAA